MNEPVRGSGEGEGDFKQIQCGGIKVLERIISSDAEARESPAGIRFAKKKR